MMPRTDKGAQAWGVRALGCGGGWGLPPFTFSDHGNEDPHPSSPSGPIHNWLPWRSLSKMDERRQAGEEGGRTGYRFFSAPAPSG